MADRIDKNENPQVETVQATDAHAFRQFRRAVSAMLVLVAFTAIIIGVAMLLGYVADQKPVEQDQSSAVTTPVVYDPFYVLLIGSDSRKGTAIYTGKDNEQGQAVAYADIMTLMRVDPQSYTITLVTIPRDSVVDDDSPKVNAALNGDDPQKVVDEVARLTGIEADYYAMTTFASFEILINSMGGIDVDVPRTVTVTDPMTVDNVTVQAGQDRHLNGAEALVFSRARKQYASYQEALRQNNVRTTEIAIINKVLSQGSELDIQEMVDAFEANVETNMDMSQVAALALDFMLHKDLVIIYEATGPYDGDIRPSDESWVVPNDPDAWARIKSLTDSGFDPSGVIEAPTFEEADPQK